jgi:hypothetical protein
MPVYENCHFVSFRSTELKMCGEMWGDVELSRQSIPNSANPRNPTAAVSVLSREF